MAKNDRVSSISHSRSIREMADFWDTHDATDFDEQTYQVSIEFDLDSRRHYLALEPDLIERLRAQAQAQGISLEKLANLWLRERAWASGH